MKDVDGVQVGFRLRYQNESHYRAIINGDERRVVRYDDGRYAVQYGDDPLEDRKIEAVKQYRRQEYDAYVKWHGESDHALYTKILPFEE